MSRILHTWLFRMHRVPVVAVLAVCLLSGSFVLPTVHHFCEHHADADADDCPVCVFAAVGAALPTSGLLAPDRGQAGIIATAAPAGAGERLLVSASPRAPPLSA